LADDGQGGQTWATAFVDVRPPPNVYPTINVFGAHGYAMWYGGSAYYNPVEIWQNFTYQINDESPGSVSMQIIAQDSGDLVNSPVFFSGWNTRPNYTVYTGDAIQNGPLQNNSFQYHKYDGWGADGVQMSFDIRLTDQHGVVNVASVYVGIEPAIGINSLSVTHAHTGNYVAPVLIDLMNDGFSYQAANVSAVRYDVNGDGAADQIAWVGHDDGVLVWDKDHNGQVSDASEFSFASLKAGAKTDLEGLQALDTNHNGLLDAGDAAWAEFGVWQDKNGDGKSDGQDNVGEFQTLDQLGFASINLHSNAQMRDATSDVTVMGDAAYTRTDGSTGALADAMLAYVPAAESADINRMALLFNQMVNTASTDYVEPLGFVPLQADSAHSAYWAGEVQPEAELRDKQWVHTT
jgi:hypothetical protein